MARKLGFLKRGSKEKPEEKKPELLIEDYPFEDLESITADLPGSETAEETTTEPEEETASDTPDEAMAKFRRERGIPALENAIQEEQSLAKDKKMNAKGRLHARRIHIEEDDEADDVPSMKAAHPFLRRMVIGIISVVFIAVLVVFLLSGSGYIGSKYRDIPAQGVSTLVTPVQRAFSWLTESFAGYFRQMKLRANLEEAYNEVVAENERLTYIALMAEEYQYQLSQYENMSEEIAWNPNMQMIICTIIGRSDGN